VRCVDRRQESIALVAEFGPSEPLNVCEKPRDRCGQLGAVMRTHDAIIVEMAGACQSAWAGGLLRPCVRFAGSVSTRHLRERTR